MFAHRLHEARLGPFIPLGLRKAHLFPHFQLVEAVFCDAVAVKVDFPAVAAGDEAVSCSRMDRGDCAVRRDLVFFHLPLPFADDVLKLPARGLERIADGYINVLMGPGSGGLAAYGDIRGVGNGEMKS